MFSCTLPTRRPARPRADTYEEDPMIGLTTKVEAEEAGRTAPLRGVGSQNPHTSTTSQLWQVQQDQDSKKRKRTTAGEWDSLLDAQFCFLSWKFLQHGDSSIVDDDGENKKQQGDGGCVYKLDRRHVLEKDWPELLIPFDRKKRVVYICYRSIMFDDPSPKWLPYLKDQKATLSQQFDGFFVFHSCLCDWTHDGYLRQKQMDCLSNFISKCYVMVVNEYEVFRHRFWMMWECLSAAKNRRLIINEYVEPLLAVVGTNPTLDKVKELLLPTQPTDEPDLDRKHLMDNIETLYLEGAHYYLIPVKELETKSEWSAIQPVPLSVDQVNPSRIFMVSHRWLSKDHPDESNVKLGLIREFWQKSNGAYDYFFFDYVCIDQQKSITRSLVKVDELYAQSHCLCLCDGDYFERSWCLFEMSINKFNVDSMTLVPDMEYLMNCNDDYSYCRNAKSVLSWLQKARLVQRMGYVHALREHALQVEDDKHALTSLQIPSDQLHLKAQLRELFLMSRITNIGDKRILLNLLDQLIGKPS